MKIEVLINDVAQARMTPSEFAELVERAFGQPAAKNHRPNEGKVYLNPGPHFWQPQHTP